VGVSPSQADWHRVLRSLAKRPALKDRPGSSPVNGTNQETNLGWFTALLKIR
jgi:hypothetical protein